LEILKSFLGGDRKALNALVGRYHNNVTRFLFSLVGQWQDAEDLANNVWVNVVGALDRGLFDHEHDFRPWLWQIVRNQAWTALRGQRNRRVLESIEPGMEEKDIPNIAFDEPLDQLIHLESAERLRAALDRLPNNRREIILLHYFQGLSYAEMAEILKCSRGTLASGLNDARRRLHEALGDSTR
jgi:RNA polymerase sigma-70 factor (ECF subfamily)